MLFLDSENGISDSPNLAFCRGRGGSQSKRKKRPPRGRETPKEGLACKFEREVADRPFRQKSSRMKGCLKKKPSQKEGTMVGAML